MNNEPRSYYVVSGEKAHLRSMVVVLFTTYRITLEESNRLHEMIESPDYESRRMAQVLTDNLFKRRCKNHLNYGPKG